MCIAWCWFHFKYTIFLICGWEKNVMDLVLFFFSPKKSVNKQPLATLCRGFCFFWRCSKVVHRPSFILYFQCKVHFHDIVFPTTGLKAYYLFTDDFNVSPLHLWLFSITFVATMLNAKVQEMFTIFKIIHLFWFKFVILLCHTYIMVRIEFIMNQNMTLQ